MSFIETSEPFGNIDDVSFPKFFRLKISKHYLNLNERNIKGELVKICGVPKQIISSDLERGEVMLSQHDLVICGLLVVVVQFIHKMVGTQVTDPKNEKPRCNFLDLSDYSLLHVFSFVSATTLYQLSRTCKRFEDLVKEKRLWYIIDAREGPINKDKITFCIGNMNSCTTQLYVSANNRCEQISNYSFLKVNAGRNLCVLALENQLIRGDLVMLGEYPDTLIELSLRKSFVQNFSQFFRHSDVAMKNLKVLILDECGWVESEMMMPFSKYPKLEVLSLYMCKKLSDSDISYLSLAGCFGFKNLRVLDVRFTGLGDQILKIFYKHNKLHDLYFQSYVGTYTLEKTQRELELVIGCPLRKNAYLSPFDNIPDTQLEPMRMYFGKHTYKTYRMQTVSDEGVMMYKFVEPDLTQDYKLDSVLYEPPYSQCRCGFYYSQGANPKTCSNSPYDSTGKDFESKKSEIARLEQMITSERRIKFLSHLYMLKPKMHLNPHRAQINVDDYQSEASVKNKSLKWLNVREPKNEYEIAMLEHADLHAVTPDFNVNDIIIDLRTLRNEGLNFRDDESEDGASDNEAVFGNPAVRHIMQDMMDNDRLNARENILNQKEDSEDSSSDIDEDIFKTDAHEASSSKEDFFARSREGDVITTKNSCAQVDIDSDYLNDENMASEKNKSEECIDEYSFNGWSVNGMTSEERTLDTDMNLSADNIYKQDYNIVLRNSLCERDKEATANQVSRTNALNEYVTDECVPTPICTPSDRCIVCFKICGNKDPSSDLQTNDEIGAGCSKDLTVLPQSCSQQEAARCKTPLGVALVKGAELISTCSKECRAAISSTLRSYSEKCSRSGKLTSTMQEVCAKNQVTAKEKGSHVSPGIKSDSSSSNPVLQTYVSLAKPHFEEGTCQGISHGKVGYSEGNMKDVEESVIESEEVPSNSPDSVQVDLPKIVENINITEGLNDEEENGEYHDCVAALDIEDSDKVAQNERFTNHSNSHGFQIVDCSTIKKSGSSCTQAVDCSGAGSKCNVDIFENCRPDTSFSIVNACSVQSNAGEIIKDKSPDKSAGSTVNGYCKRRPENFSSHFDTSSPAVNVHCIDYGNEALKDAVPDTGVTASSSGKRKSDILNAYTTYKRMKCKDEAEDMEDDTDPLGNTNSENVNDLQPGPSGMNHSSLTKHADSGCSSPSPGNLDLDSRMNDDFDDQGLGGSPTSYASSSDSESEWDKPEDVAAAEPYGDVRILIGGMGGIQTTTVKKLSLRGYGNVTDISLYYLSMLKLELLDVTQTGVTKRGVRDFILRNPECRVIHESTCVCRPRLHF